MHRLHGGVFMKDDQTAARAFLGALILAGIAFFGGVRYPFGDSVPPPIWVQLIKIFVIDFVCLLAFLGVDHALSRNHAALRALPGALILTAMLFLSGSVGFPYGEPGFPPVWQALMGRFVIIFLALWACIRVGQVLSKRRNP